MVWSGRERYGQVEKGNRFNSNTYTHAVIALEYHTVWYGQVEKGNRFNSNTYTHDVIVLEYHTVWYGQVEKGMVRWRKVIGLIAIHTHTLL